MDTVTGLAAVAFAKKLVDFIKAVVNLWNPDVKKRTAAKNNVLLQGVAWIGSILAVILIAQTLLSDGEIFGFSIGTQSIWGQVVIGLLIGSTASFAQDTLNAVDPNKTSTSLSLVFAAASKDTPQSTIPITELEVSTPEKGADDVKS